MRAFFNFLYLLCSYGIFAGSIYFAFYERTILWARLLAYAFGGVAAAMIFNAERIIKDEYRETRFSSAISGFSAFLVSIGVVCALFGLWVFDPKIAGNVPVSAVGWCVSLLGLVLGAVGKLIRELYKSV
jgi:hypothetical protein